MLSQITGQVHALEALRNYLRDDHVSGSFLFIGPNHVGKATAALQFTKALNCTDRQPGPDCCDRCFNCRSIEAGKFGDVRIVQPVGPSRILRIAQIWPRDGVTGFPADTALLRDLQFAPAQGFRRVFIIEDADSLNDETANSLLKVLEEPPNYATFILTAPSASAVLPTIFSRCRTIRFQNVSQTLIEEELIKRGSDSSQSRLIAALSQGQIGSAITQASDNELYNIRTIILNIVEQLANEKSVIASLKYADELRKAATKLGATIKEGQGEEVSARQSSVAVLEIVVLYYRDLLAMCVPNNHSVTIINVDKRENLSRISEYYNSDRLLKAIELILDIRSYVERNANGQIAFEALTTRLVQLRTAA